MHNGDGGGRSHEPGASDDIDVQVNWYPGHMARALRHLAEAIPRVDVVLEVADARIPRSSRHPDLRDKIGTKPRVLLLTREDLADPDVSGAWLKALRRRGELVALANLREGGWPSVVTRLVRRAAKRRSGGLRALVTGIPNVGKSTAINALARRRGVKTGATPGVTRGLQWLAGHGGVEWLDTPGLLWPRLDSPHTRFALAATGAVPDHVLDMEDLAVALLRFLLSNHPNRLRERYGSDQVEMEGNGSSPQEWLERVGRVRKALGPGGSVDVERAAQAVLQDFRQGRLGRISLETPE